VDLIKQWFGLAALVAAGWAFVVWGLPWLSWVGAPDDVPDVDGVKVLESRYRLERAVPPEAWRRGDPICFRIGLASSHETLFGWVAGRPGDRIAVTGGKLMVNGGEAVRHAPIALPDCGPVTVPRGHFYVVSSYHRHDSLAEGMIPYAAVRGRLADFP
jgi:hypothetical protein